MNVNGAGHNLLIDSKENINSGVSSDKGDGQKESLEYFEAPENQELLEMQDKEKTLSDQKTKSDKNLIIPLKEKPDNQLTQFMKGDVAHD